MSHISVYELISKALFAAQIFGALWVIYGVRVLISGLQGSGQSEAGVRLLREAILRQLSPLLWGGLAIAALFGLCLWERSPLMILVQGVAPLSTLLWALWSHRRARAVVPGALFEALVPLTAPRRSLEEGGPAHLHRESAALIAQAERWAQSQRGLSPRSFVETALAAYDQRESSLDSTPESASGSAPEVGAGSSLHQLVSLLAEALHETRTACLGFPLGQQLTLADWLFEGERLTARWRRGLRSVNLGRALINPLTLIDHDFFWRWSKGRPDELFERELTAWLHRGLYLLVARRILEGERAAEAPPASPPPASPPPTSPSPASAGVSVSATQLWALLFNKLAVPLWLYWGLSGVALTITHGLTGAALTVFAGGLLWYTLRRSSELTRWRALCGALGAHRRAPRDAALRSDALTLIEEARARAEAGAEEAPVKALLELARDGSRDIATRYRRVEQRDPPEALLNATIVDAFASLEHLCRDLLRWQERGGALPMLLKLLEQLGQREQRLEQQLLEAARSWARSAPEEADPGANPEANPEANPVAREAQSLEEKAAAADQWLTEKVSGLNVILRIPTQLLLRQISGATRGWIVRELEERLLPLYEGRVDAPSASGSRDE